MSIRFLFLFFLFHSKKTSVNFKNLGISYSVNLFLNLVFEFYWWLIRVTLVVGLAFFGQKIFGPWWGPMNAFYCSVIVHGVVALFVGGGDT